MSPIKIDDLHHSGSELFSDSESYMNELSDGELDLVNGGTRSPVIKSIVKASKAVGETAVKASKAVGKASGKACRVVSNVSNVATITIELSNPFNSF